MCTPLFHSQNHVQLIQFSCKIVPRKKGCLSWLVIYSHPLFFWVLSLRFFSFFIIFIHMRCNNCGSNKSEADAASGTVYCVDCGTVSIHIYRIIYIFTNILNITGTWREYDCCRSYLWRNSWRQSHSSRFFCRRFR